MYSHTNSDSWISTENDNMQCKGDKEEETHIQQFILVRMQHKLHLVFGQQAKFNQADYCCEVNFNNLWASNHS